MSQSDDRRAERLALRAEKPEVWIPVDAGDYIKGTLTEVTAAFSEAQYVEADPDSGFYPLLTVKVGQIGNLDPLISDWPETYVLGAELRVHCYSAVLQARLLDWEPAVDETVTILYQGQGEAKPDQSPPELWKLKVYGRDPAEQAARVYGRIKRRRPRTKAPAEAIAAEVSGVKADLDDIPF